MSDTPGELEETARSARERLSHALPAILLALNLVLIGVIIARPWETVPIGPVPQVEPTDPALRDLPTEPAVGSLAPNFDLSDPDGNAVELASLRGRPVILNFWATWCIYCVSEMPAFQRIADDYEGEIVVVGVNVGESDATVRTFAENFDIAYPLLLDSAIDVTGEYQVIAMPTTLVIDRDGVIRDVRYGPVTPSDVIGVITPLLRFLPPTSD